MKVERAAARVLPPDALRLIYLEYCKAYCKDTSNQLHLACEYFGPDGKLHVHREKLRVLTRFRDTRYAICSAGRPRFLASGPMGPAELDVLTRHVFGHKWRARHHRMDIVSVCAKTIRGDYSYSRPKRDIRAKVDVSGPEARFIM